MPRVKILDDPKYQDLVIKRIQESGKEKGCWEGVCTEKTFYKYKKGNEPFIQRIKHARDEFRSLIWEDRPDLRKLAIEALEKALKGHKQTWQKQRMQPNESGEFVEVAREITRTQHNPSQWAIEAMLGIGRFATEQGESAMQEKVSKIIIEY